MLRREAAAGDWLSPWFSGQFGQSLMRWLASIGVIDTRIWGTGLIWIAVILTIWSMVYYLQKALPEIRAKAR